MTPDMVALIASLMVVKSDSLKSMVVVRLEVAEGKATSLLGVAHPTGVALGPEEEIGVVARSSSNSISSSNSQAALVVAVEDPEMGVAPGGAGRLKG